MATSWEVQKEKNGYNQERELFRTDVYANFLLL